MTLKTGRMEGWKDGRMEGWKDGRMEGWNGMRSFLHSEVVDLSQATFGRTREEAEATNDRSG